MSRPPLANDSLADTRLAWISGLALALCLLGSNILHAGGGPENVFLVVNKADNDSMAIANHYIQLRQIPAGCVVYLDWPHPPFQTDLHAFRHHVLDPVLAAIEKRKLTDQIDYIVYSSGFPYAVKYDQQVKSAKPNYSVGSITGLTYLHETVLSGKLNELSSARLNRYAYNLKESVGSTSAGFQSKYGLDRVGQRVSGGDGNRYYLSMMLGHTGGKRNNTISEIFKYLKASRHADGTRPNGTVYYMKNANIRSSVRHGQFGQAIEELRALGVSAEEIAVKKENERDVMPVKKPAVSGAMVGYFKHTWGLTGSKIVPGAICENFTSYGGVMSGAKSQSLLANFLKFGAAASSGTVVEPYAIAAKFPHARIHVHYARGCSAAEAYYQSVSTPYQLLIVGDPLCQPWAEAPTVSLKEFSTKRVVTGALTLKPSAKSKQPIRNYNIFIDDRRVGQCLPGESFQFDSSLLADGYHELRVVAVVDSPIETQGRLVTHYISHNPPASGQGEQAAGGKTSATPRVAAAWDGRDRELLSHQTAKVRVRSPGAREIRLYRGRDLIGVHRGSNGSISVSVSELGGGPVTLRAVAFPKKRGQKMVFGAPFTKRVSLLGSINR